MFTLVAFHEVINIGGVEANIAGLPDQHKKVIGDQIFIDDYNLLIGALALCGTTPVSARLVSPSLRKINPHWITPPQASLTPIGTDVINISPSVQIPLEINEGLEGLINATGGVGENPTILVWLADRAPEAVKGNIRRVRFTTTLVLTVDQWSFGEIDLTDELPVGNYKCVGGKVIAANGIAFRFVPKGGTNRPGGQTNPAVAGVFEQSVHKGDMGEWFTFSTLLLPGIEILDQVGAVSATYEGFMDIIPG